MLKCFRCKKTFVKSADNTNADYIMASDTIANEKVATYIVLKHNKKTLKKAAKGKSINISEFNKVKHDNFAQAIKEKNVYNIKEIKEMKPVQKTGLICPKCYKSKDMVIWGVHKGK